MSAPIADLYARFKTLDSQVGVPVPTVLAITIHTCISQQWTEAERHVTARTGSKIIAPSNNHSCIPDATPASQRTPLLPVNLNSAVSRAAAPSSHAEAAPHAYHDTVSSVGCWCHTPVTRRASQALDTAAAARVAQLASDAQQAAAQLEALRRARELEGAAREREQQAAMDTMRREREAHMAQLEVGT